MKVWDEVSKRHIDIEIVFSGKTMPGDGPSPGWPGSGSLSSVNQMKGIAYGDLVTPADLRGKAPADMPFSAKRV